MWTRSKHSASAPPCVKRQLNSTPQDALTVSPQLDFTMTEGYPVPSPFLKATKLHNVSLQHSIRGESPAKAFAKLKTKVQNQQIRANEGIRTNSDMFSGVGKKGGAAFNSPRKENDNEWTIEKLMTNQQSMILQYDEAEPLTLSFTCSPRKGLPHPFSELSSNHLQSPRKGVGTFLDPRHRCTPTKNPVLDVCPVPYSPRMTLPHPLQVKSKRAQRPPAPVRDLDDFEMPNRGPPERGQSPSLASTDDDLGRDASADRDVERSASPSFLRHSFTPQDKPTSTTFDMYEMEEVDTHVDAFGRVAGSEFPVIQSGMTREAVDCQLEIDPRDNVPPPATKRRPALAEDRPLHDSPRTSISKTSTAEDYVSLERLPPLTPSKIFAHMKERERRRQQQQEEEVYKVSSSTKDLWNRGHSRPQHNKPTSTTFYLDDMDEEDNTCVNACGSLPKSALPVNQSEMIPTRLETVDSQSEIDPCDDVPPPAVKSHPVLIEDPLVINSPQISFPKKREAVFKNMTEPSGSKHKQETKVMGIYLQHWVLKCNQGGLYVDGMRSDNLAWWHTNIIAERVSSSVVKTVSGSTYILRGKMNMHATSTLPKWFLKKFLFGFPQRWKQFHKQLLTESKGMEADSQRKETKRREWPLSEKAATSFSSKQRVMTSALCPPVSCPPASFSAPGGTQQSRSGRVIRPPLDYWRGGRTVLDADNNVTVYTCYETTICKSPDDTPVSRRESKRSQKAARVFSPCNDGHRQSEAISSNDVMSVPVRKVRTTSRRRARASVDPDQSSSNQIESPGDQDWSFRSRKSSSPRSPVTETAPNTDVGTLCQVQLRRLTRWRSDKLDRRGDTGAPPESVWRKPQNLPAPLEPPAVFDVTTKKRTYPKRLQKPSNSDVKSKPDQKVIQQSEQQGDVEKTRDTHEQPRKRVAAVRSGKAQNMCDIVEEEEESQLNNSSYQKNWGGRMSSRRGGRGVIEYTDSEPRRTYPKRSQKPSNSDAQSKPDQKVIQQSEQQRDAEKTSEDEEESQSNNSSNQTKRGGRMSNRRRGREVLYTESEPSRWSLSSQSPNSLDDSGKEFRKSGTGKKRKADKPIKSPPPKPTPKPTQSKAKSSKGNGKVNSKTVVPQEEEDEEEWTERELARLQEAVTSCPKHMRSFWMKVAAMVGTRSAGECQKQYTSHETFLAPVKKTKKKQAPNKEAESPKITARAGTLKRKQQIRQVLETIPKDNHDDIFSSTPMQKMRFQHPSTESPSEKEHPFMNSVEDLLSPGSTGFAIVKSPQNLHITPGMMGSVNRNNDDKMIYQLQKRMKKSQAAVHRHTSAPKNFSPTPSVKRTMRRCSNAENDAFVIWKMFPDNDEASIESGEEEDYYFTDD